MALCAPLKVANLFRRGILNAEELHQSHFRLVPKNRSYFPIVRQDKWHCERCLYPFKVRQSRLVNISPSPEIRLPLVVNKDALQFAPFHRSNRGQFADHGIASEKSHKFYMRCGQALRADGPTIASFVDSPAPDTSRIKRD